MKNKTHVYFILKGGFYAHKSEYPTLKETLEKYGFKRSQIIDWWRQ